MSSIETNAKKILHDIETAEVKHAIDINSVQLLAVSKTKPVTDIEQAIAAGLCQFGENYIQEGVEKIHYFSERSNLVWHLIGPIQSNKTQAVANHFDWVHSLDRSKIAKRLNDQRPIELAPLQVLIQVNTSAEATKSGLPLANKAEIIALANQIEQLPNLSLRGLMCIPAPAHSFSAQLAAFAPLKQLFDELKPNYAEFDTLSMGMSDDMEAAVASGSNMVRIGSAIFGNRNYA